MREFLKRVEDALSAAFRSNTLLDQTGSHLCLASDAKRVRPLLTAYFAQALNIPLEEVVPLAVASELIHSASLLHDDVVDDGKIRRGRPTVNIQWSNSVAVLSGNYLLSLAFDQLKEFSPKLIQEAISVVSEMTQAAMLEIQMRESLDYNLDDWRRMATGKTGSLFAFCGTSVALYAGHLEAQKAFMLCGRHIGQVFQLADDLGDIQEDAQNQEASYPRLMSVQGEINPVLACQKELENQVALAIQALGPWALTLGGTQIKTWAEQLACFASSYSVSS